MKKYLKWILPGLLAMAIGALIWLLDLPHWKRLDLDLIQNLPESTAVYDCYGEKTAALGATRPREHATLSQLPDDVKNAFIAAEDQRFYTHSGVDVKRMLGALISDIKARSFVQGASTITQQLIKITHLSSDKTISRKVQEIALARQLERKLSKDEILEAYLNAVYFGNGAFGIQSAAQAYFSKDASALTLAEGALLAGVIKSPSKYAPHLHPENALQRRNYVLSFMADMAAITQDAAAQAQAESLNLNLQTNAASYGWFADLALGEAQEILGLDAEEVMSGGYHIYTGFNSDMQDAVDSLFENGANFPDPAADGTPVQAALIALDPGSGEIRAVAGGREYAVQRGLNRATQSRRQPGSAIKPISTYAAAIDRCGFLPSSMIEDVQREFPGKYLPGNAGGKYYGTVTLREALSRSLNVATVDLADLIGISRVRSAMAGFGVAPAAQDVNLSLALGSMTYGVTPAALGAAYCALANGGTRIQAHAIRRITDANGKQLYQAAAPSETAVSAESAFLLTDMLKTAAASGSARALSACGLPVAGKTGTVGEAGGGNRDIWTAAYTPDLSVTVWMGFDDPDSSHAISDYAGGGSYPAALCAALLGKIAPLLSKDDFIVPNSLAAVKIDRAALSERHEVLLAARNTPEEYVQTEYFRKSQLPTQVSSLWDAPEAVDDLHLLDVDGAIALSFTAKDANADYLVLRKSGADSEIAAVLSGNAGEAIVWADDTADMGTKYAYSILPRHRLLYESGTVLTGRESDAVEYRPSLARRVFG